MYKRQPYNQEITLRLSFFDNMFFDWEIYINMILQVLSYLEFDLVKTTLYDYFIFAYGKTGEGEDHLNAMYEIVYTEELFKKTSYEIFYNLL